MPNEQITVPLFTAGEILTAANMNISAGTGVPVFATTTTRDAAFGGAGEKVLAEGQLCYLSSTNVVQYYDGAAWATVGPAAAPSSGLVRIGSTSLSGSSTNITSVFSTTYKNYRIIIDDAVATARGYMSFRIGANVSSSIYYYAGISRLSSGSTDFTGGNAANLVRLGNWENATQANIRAYGATIEIQNPYEAKTTTFQNLFGGGSITDTYAGTSGGVVNDTTSYTGFTIGTEAGTFTGNVTVYGYANS
jgi:hypothetical protein